MNSLAQSPNSLDRRLYLSITDRLILYHKDMVNY